MKLTKRMSQYKGYSKYNDIWDYEVIERNKIEEILNNLNEKEIKENILTEAMVFENETGCVYAELDVRTGEFECNFYINDFLPSRADLIVVLSKCEVPLHREEFDMDDVVDEEEWINILSDYVEIEDDIEEQLDRIYTEVDDEEDEDDDLDY